VKKILLLIVIGIAVFVAIYRQRIYVWDPIASVTRDGVKQGGVRVMINYSNDVLVQDSNTHKTYLVQTWDKVAKYSLGPLKCVEYLACMADGDQASGEPVVARRAGFAGVAMTNRRVEFLDQNAAVVNVWLR
jgi:hypothetical protein